MSQKGSQEIEAVLYNLEKLEQDVHKLLQATPVDSNKVPSEGKQQLEVKCFGNFEVFYQGIPLTFKYQKTKELLAFLIDRLGAKVSNKQIICTLWEDDADHKEYYQALRKDLLHTLRKLPFAVIQTGYGSLAVDREAVDCDYFAYRAGREQIKYYGEYMEQYPWAVTTRAALDGIFLSE